MLLFRWNTIREVVVLHFKVKTFPSRFKEVSPLILCSPQSWLTQPPTPPPPLTPSTNRQSLLWKSHVRDVTNIRRSRKVFLIGRESSILIRKLLHSAIMISTFAWITYIFHLWRFFIYWINYNIFDAFHGLKKEEVCGWMSRLSNGNVSSKSEQFLIGNRKKVTFLNWSSFTSSYPFSIVITLCLAALFDISFYCNDRPFYDLLLHHYILSMPIKTTFNFNYGKCTFDEVFTKLKSKMSFWLLLSVNKFKEMPGWLIG